MKKYYHILISGALASCILLFATVAIANITLTNGEWSSTFDCADFSYTYGDPVVDSNCDGWGQIYSGANVGYYLKIESAANNPNGGGDKGMSWQIGNGSVTEVSPMSAHFALAWSGSTHFWIRWYIYIPAGLSIGYGDPNLYGWKVMYLWDGATSFIVNANYRQNGISISNHSTTWPSFDTGNDGFSDAYGSTTSPGEWMPVEMEFDVTNGIFRYWFYPDNIDNSTPAYTLTNISYQFAKVSQIEFPSNIRSSGISSPPSTFYFDDIAISENGRIGPIGSGNAPLPPKRLRIVYSGEGSINTGGGPSPAETLLTEDLDDLNLSSRGWFDGSPSSGVIDTSTKYSGAGAMKWTWPSGSKTPAGMQTIRKDFTPSDELYTSFYWRFNSDWKTDTGLANWPHLIYILSDADDHWSGLARNVLDTYMEVEGLIPKLHIQDGENINTNPTPPWSNTGGTEDRAVAGCNGNIAGADVGTGVTCYQSGSIWMNIRWWDGMSTFSLNSWQHVEVYLKMNSVSGGVGQSDGIMRHAYPVDSQSIF